ncbi:hypothetical protein OE88DRAFT_1657374 [Heliocybe sulcata]|uniref:Uncharacterized protein n=1 Tax=Heliocybe sulcata TaxID=5364 RepID=A0A5C3N3N9_9AGAM|nr:hypothetical protein OE88DRAFT_1657374 [Heliocybe sulcata]
MSARPRPRPRARVASSSSNAGPSGSTDTNANPQPKSFTTTVDDEDALFMKNRTQGGWKKLEQLIKEKERHSTPATDEQSSGAETEDWDAGEQSPRRSRKKKTKKNGKSLPAWARKKIIHLLSSDDDDEEDALQTIDNVSPRRRAEQQAQKRQKRSRSRSITPPPPLSYMQIQNARNLVRQALEIDEARPESPPPFEDEGDSTATIVLNPELLQIAKEVRTQTSSFVRDPSLDPELGGGPETVIISVKWQPHPEDESGRSQLWKFKVKRHDTFKTLFEETADEAGILVENLIVTHDGNRLYAVSTPHVIGIWAEAELVACDKTAYEYMRTHRHQSAPAPTDDNEHWLPRARSQTAGLGSDAESESGAESQGDSDDKFKLVLRSAITSKGITLTVRPTTTCAAIVKAFLKSAGLADKYPEGKSTKGRKKGGDGPRLVVDGDKMDPTSPISEADLEDGDQVEVVGL